MAEVDFQKVDASHDCLVSPCVADLDENEEDESDEEKERGEKGEGKASAGRCPDSRGRRMWSAMARSKAGGGRRGRCSGFFLRYLVGAASRDEIWEGHRWWGMSGEERRGEERRGWEMREASEGPKECVE